MARSRVAAIIAAGVVGLGLAVWVPVPAGAAPGHAQQAVRDDFDGDGVPDIAIGKGQTRVLHLHYSSATVDHSHVAYLRVPGDGRMYYPFTLEPGDYNGDGIDDLAVGDWYRAPRSAVFVFLGSRRHGLRDVPATTLLGPLPPHHSFAYWQFGRALAAGDVDGDGRDDLAVGLAKMDADDDATRGKVQIFRGSPSGLSSENPIQVLYGIPVPVAFADVDGDGHADLVAGNAERYAPRVLVFAGTGDGFAAQPTTVAEGDFPFGATADIYLFPKAVGDVNHDGYADVIAADPKVGPDPDGARSGAILLLLGGPDGLSDDHSQVIYESQVHSPPEQDGRGADEFGHAVAIGDVTGSDYPDVLIGARLQWVGGVKWAGAVFLLHGSADGLSLVDPKRFTLKTPGVPGVARPGAQFGYALSVADFTGDGTDDVVIGAPGPHATKPGTHQQPGYVIGLAGGSSDLFKHYFSKVIGAGPYDQLGVAIA
jgi:hypothetical protein